MGYLSQTTSVGNGISKELFTQALKALIDCKTEAIPIWTDFAAECVEQGQYVDFQESDGCIAINRWLETLLAGLLQVKTEFGDQIASTLCNLAIKNECLYPYEMLLAAEHLKNDDPQRISELIQSGALEPASAFFPKLSNDSKIDDPNESMDCTILGM